MSYGYIPELPSALPFDIERRRNVALEVRAERNRRLDQPSLRTRLTAWFDHRRTTIGADRHPGSQERPGFRMHL